MSSDQNACPNCAKVDQVRAVPAAAADPALAHKLAVPASPRHHGRDLGCGALLISSLAGFGAGTFVGILAMLTGLDVANRQSGVADAGIFSAILVFMVVFVGVYAAFVWRQARADTLLRRRVIGWHQARDRWEQLAYCARCDGVFLPGQARLVPAEQMQGWLLQEVQRPASTPAQAAR
jgi:hypothetical protein